MGYETAVHEAGHAAASVLLGCKRHAGPVTIVPGKTYHGICFPGRADPPPVSDLDQLEWCPWPLLPARMRRFYESWVMVALAGRIAEELYLIRGDVAGPEFPAAPAPQAVEAVHSLAQPVVVRLPERESDLLGQAAAADEIDSDMGQASRLLLALHGGDELRADRHGAFLAAETTVLMGRQRSGRMVRVLAGELMTAGTLPARRWQAILAGVR